MTTKRRRIGARQLRSADVMPGAVRWWLAHGRPLGIVEAEALGMTARDAWTISNLAFDRPIVRGWCRAELRELGFGGTVDQHIAAGCCRPDRSGA